MKKFSNQSNLSHAINPLIGAISSGNNVKNNNQQSFQEQTKEFLSNLEEILIRQNQNFLLLYGDNSKKCYPPRKSSS